MIDSVPSLIRSSGLTSRRFGSTELLMQAARAGQSRINCGLRALLVAFVGLALLVAGILVGTVSAAAENGVGASTPAVANTVGSSSDIGAGQRPGKSLPLPGIVVATGVAAEGAEAAAGGARQVTVLGRYTGGVDAYVGKPGFNTLNLPKSGTGRWNWTRNKRFIDDAIDRGDEIRLVTNPNEPLYQGGNTFQRELRYLQDRGYTWQEQGDYWNAVPR